jgi:hypothetical protein
MAQGIPLGGLRVLTPENCDKVTEVMICERFGWTLDYVRNLGDEDYRQIQAVISGLATATGR